jgi:nucleotide-binding universal stress UspA family protein
MFKNVVWATDGSAHADRALQYAKNLVQRDGGTLHVTHIVEILMGARVAGQNANVNEPEIEAKIKDQGRQAEHEGLQVKFHFLAGNDGAISRLIADEAAAAQADVIVVGTRGHSAVVATVVGSVTQRLLHVAGCPVLAVPPLREGRHEDEMPDAVATA